MTDSQPPTDAVGRAATREEPEVICPECGGRRIAPVISGLIYRDALDRLAQQHEFGVVWGGCMLNQGRHYCRDCEIRLVDAHGKTHAHRPNEDNRRSRTGTDAAVRPIHRV